MFSTDFISRQQENLVDNQKCQTGCNNYATKYYLDEKLNGGWQFTKRVSCKHFFSRLAHQWDFAKLRLCFSDEGALLNHPDHCAMCIWRPKKRKISIIIWNNLLDNWTWPLGVFFSYQLCSCHLLNIWRPNVSKVSIGTQWDVIISEVFNKLFISS